MRLPLLALAALALAGCVTTIDPSAPYPPVPVDEVVVYEGDADIPGEFEVIRRIEPRRSSYTPLTMHQVIEDARRKAAALGANGLILVTGNEGITDNRVRQAYELGGTVHRTEMVAIRVFPAGE